jgi:hypothetical protein
VSLFAARISEQLTTENAVKAKTLEGVSFELHQLNAHALFITHTHTHIHTHIHTHTYTHTHTHTHTHIQGVTGGTDQTSGGCSLC